MNTTGITTKPLTYVTADGREFTDADKVPETRLKLTRDRILGWIEFDAKGVRRERH